MGERTCCALLLLSCYFFALVVSVTRLDSISSCVMCCLLLVYGQSQCEREVSCQDCISLSPRCVWCSDEVHSNSINTIHHSCSQSVNISVRCFDKDMPTYNCDNIQDPESVMSGEEVTIMIISY